MRDFVSIEMMFHARALELLSRCYQNLEEMHEDNDLEVGSLHVLSSTNEVVYSKGEMQLLIGLFDTGTSV